MILLPNQSMAFSPPSSRHKSCLVDLLLWTLCVLLSLSHRPALLERLKGTKLDHRDSQCEPYPQHKRLSAGLIDKLPLHFISQTDRA